jgi:NH3-dependent NAD+ synthetase
MSVCVLALVIRQAKHMRRYFVAISGLFDSTVLLTLCHKRHDFRKHIIEHKMGVVIFATTCV